MLIGDIDVHPLTDGTFRASPAYFGEHVRAEGHEDLFSRDSMAWLPIGCFLVRTGDRTILVDAGIGPEMRDDGPRRFLVGGQLLLGLRAVGVTPADVTDVVCTHLHADHCGWLFDRNADPVFTRAAVWFGARDWDHFVANPEVLMFDHIRRGFRAASERQGDRLRPVADDTAIAPGVTVTMTPGHTPGISASSSPPAAAGRCFSATRSSARSSSTSPPGSRSATSTPSSRGGSANGCSASSRTRRPSVLGRTSRSSSSAVCWPVREDAGSPDTSRSDPVRSRAGPGPPRGLPAAGAGDAGARPRPGDVAVGADEERGPVVGAAGLRERGVAGPGVLLADEDEPRGVALDRGQRSLGERDLGGAGADQAVLAPGARVAEGHAGEAAGDGVADGTDAQDRGRQQVAEQPGRGGLSVTARIMAPLWRRTRRPIGCRSRW